MIYILLLNIILKGNFYFFKNIERFLFDIYHEVDCPLQKLLLQLNIFILIKVKF